MDTKTLLARLKRDIATKYGERAAVVNQLKELRGQDAPDETQVEAKLAERAAIDTELEAMEARAADYAAEIAEDEAAEQRAAGAQLPEERAVTHRVEVTKNEDIYRADQDPKGEAFLRDVASAFVGHTGARSRLEGHTAQMFDERKRAGNPVSERAAGVGAMSGFAVPEYLTDLYAPAAKAGAPLIENMNQHQLPETGMSAYLSKITTATSVDEQATEGTDVDETDIDDTLVTVPIFTVAGSQSVSRQLLDRGGSAVDVTVEDLIRSYWTDLDSKAINRASTGLSAAATAITYTDGDPTAAELYAKILQGALAVETAVLDQMVGGTMVLMHPRRWRWLQNQFIATHPFISGRMAGANGEGKLSGEGYGAGIRGYLPSDDPVIADANIGTALGAGTEDQVFVFAKNEAHVWLDNGQPLMIKAEQSQVKKLLVDFVVYGYAATYFARYTGAAQKIGGTGLIAPTF